MSTVSLALLFAASRVRREGMKDGALSSVPPHFVFFENRRQVSLIFRITRVVREKIRGLKEHQRGDSEMQRYLAQCTNAVEPRTVVYQVYKGICLCVCV